MRECCAWTRDQSATILLVTVNGLSLELITSGAPAGFEAAHHALADYDHHTCDLRPDPE